MENGLYNEDFDYRSPAGSCRHRGKHFKPDTPGWVGQFDEWAGKKDMPAYNPNFTPVPIRKMDEETAKNYTEIEVIDPNMSFPMANCYIVQNTSIESVMIKFTGPELEDDQKPESAPIAATAPGFDILCTIGAIASVITLAQIRYGDKRIR